MPQLSLFLHGDGIWPDSKDNAHWVGEEGNLSIARLSKGMQSGESSVAIRIDGGRPDGKAVIIQTSMRLFQLAAKAFVEVDKEEGIDNA
jgi:hypothetical protein